MVGGLVVVEGRGVECYVNEEENKWDGEEGGWGILTLRRLEILLFILGRSCACIKDYYYPG